MSAQYDRESDSYKKVLDYTKQLFSTGVVDLDAAVIDSKQRTNGSSRLIKEWFDWLLSDEGWPYVRFGMEGFDYKTVDGEKVYDPEVKAPWRQAVVRRARDSDFFIAPSLPIEEQEKVKPWIEKSVDSAQFSMDRGFVPPASKQPNYLDYEMTWDQNITRILIGDLPVDTFDDLLEGWYSHGGQQYVEQMNEFISSTQ